jgi:hypothetical protein
MKAWLKEVQPAGKAAQFVAAESGEAAGTFFLELCGEVLDDGQHLQVGECFAICTQSDAEPDDLVVWWTGSAASLALARVGFDLQLHSIGGFPAPHLPPNDRGEARGLHGACIRGVVVGRLRQMRSAS